uniref:(northern house mosquito) hypothetical protein n=1 Tax=Culex pipiens TaxID=7175 RepID=A0A8D8C7S9_CULPI
MTSAPWNEGGSGPKICYATVGSRVCRWSNLSLAAAGLQGWSSGDARCSLVKSSRGGFRTRCSGCCDVSHTSPSVGEITGTFFAHKTDNTARVQPCPGLISDI